MRAVIAAVLVLAATAAVPPALGAATEPYTLELEEDVENGGGVNEITIGYDGLAKEYVITANGRIGPVRTCTNPPDDPNELRCPEKDLLGITVKAGRFNDTVTVKPSVLLSTILLGGPGTDDLAGGSNTDRVAGGPGSDTLLGRKGSDLMYGGAGRDELRGGPGKDLLRGGGGPDVLRGGPGRDDERQ